MQPSAQQLPSSRVAYLIVGIALVFVIGFVAFMSVGVSTGQCDGEVPAWMIPDDYNGSGCIELRPWWEGLLPWNSDHTPYCLGLCGDGFLPPGDP